VGNVFEPYLSLTHRPHFLLRALSLGKNFGDAVYYSLPALSWQAVAIGDPLYRPFKISLEQQLAARNQQSPALASYADLRLANLLVQQGKPAEARALLQGVMREWPGLAVALGLAKLDVAQSDPAAAVAALGFAPALKTVRAEDWALFREIAGLLAAHGARPAALQVYANMARAKAPAPDALKVLLTEARATADAAGDLKQSLELARQLSELEPAAPAAK
jgi:predicted negative regulator of RcsB-dependent stress response